MSSRAYYYFHVFHLFHLLFASITTFHQSMLQLPAVRFYCVWYIVLFSLMDIKVKIEHVLTCTVPLDYESPLGNIIWSHGLTAHFYTDDTRNTQIYLAFDHDNEAFSTAKLEKCIADILRWITSNFLYVPTKCFMMKASKRSLCSSNELPTTRLKTYGGWDFQLAVTRLWNS